MNLLHNSNSQFSNYSNLVRLDYLSECAGQKFFKHPWFYYTNMHTYRMQMYNLWHEDRTAASNHIENRVPFLDHRLVEYTMKVPPKFYRELFWNKQILRKGFVGDLPSDFIRRPKVPFYLGEDVRYTYRMLYEILMKDDRALIDEALGGPDEGHPVFERELLNDFIKNITEDTEYSGVQQLIYMVNMGLLDKMASSFGSSALRNGSQLAAPARIEIKNWDKAEANIAAQLSIRRREISTKKQFKLSDNVQLLNDKGNNIYVLVDNKLEYLLEAATCKNWIDVLSKLDGSKSLQAILDELSIQETSIRLNLEEAMDYKIIELC